MASTDTELVREARVITDYNDRVISDSQMQALVGICKDEIRAEVGNPDLTFYASDGSTFEADRALFWFVCIAAKIKTGEIGSVNLEIEDILSHKPAQGHYDVWFDNLESRLNQYVRERQEHGPAHRLIEREDDRTYGE